MLPSTKLSKAVIVIVIVMLTVIEARSVHLHQYDTTTPTHQAILEYPVVFRTQRVGIHRGIQVPDRVPTFPKLTLTTWIYLTSYCKFEGNERCTILSRVNKHGAAQTPTLYITDIGRIVFSGSLINGPSELVLSGFKIPLRQWISIQLNVYKLDIMIVVRDKDVNIIGTVLHSFHHMIALDYDSYDWSFGGDLWHFSFEGALGMTDIYANQHVDANKIRWPTASHNMFLITEEESKSCKVMRYNLYQLIKNTKETNPPSHELTFKSDKERDYFEDTVSRVGSQLLQQAYPLLEQGRTIEGFKLLSQAECYKSVNASFTKAVLAAPEKPPNGKAFLLGSLENHVQSDLALAFRHRFDIGSSGIPADCEASLVYYERLAIETHETMNNADLHDVWAETVTLSTEKDLYDQEGENSHIHRRNVQLSVDGDVEAQKRLGVQHYWGTHGRTKDLKLAYQYYQQAADQGDKQAVHEAALMKIEGIGTEKDKEQGLLMLLKNAEEGYVASLGGLGWFHSEFEDNIPKAIEYYKKGADSGDKNSMYSLGMMYVKPDLEGGPKYSEALELFEHAASKGHLAAALEAASLHKFGLGTMRSCNHAVRYYSWIGTKHSVLAKLTRAALEYYLQKDYQRAFLDYQIAAEAGCPTSQYNAAYLAEKGNSRTFHPNPTASVYYYGLAELQGNQLASIALRLYKSNLGALNSDVQKWQNSNGTDVRSQRQNPSTFGRIKFKGHVHEIVIDQDTYNVSVVYSSSDRMVVGVEIVSVDGKDLLKVWSQILLISEKETRKKRSRVTLNLPRKLRALKDKEYNILTQTVKLRTWLTHIDIWASDKNQAFMYAKDREEVELVGSWTPRKKFEMLTMCQSVLAWLLDMSQKDDQVCPVKKTWVEKGYPFVMTGKRCGVTVKDPDYSSLEENTVTLSLWFEITNRCHGDKCSLVYRHDASGKLFTPSIIVDNKQRLHVYVYLRKEGRIATFDKPLSFGKWIHVAISIKDNTLVGCTEQGKEGSNQHCQYWLFNESILFDENDGVWSLGGNTHLPGITGYFGKLQVFRDVFYPTDLLLSSVPIPSSNNPMWDTRTRKTYKMCQNS